MNITMIGTGYVGLVTGTCLAESGNDVTCVDIDQSKIERLRRGDIPIYEPALSELALQNGNAGRIGITPSPTRAVVPALFSCSRGGTTQRESGQPTLEGLKKARHTLAPPLPADVVVVIKSTVPVGTN